MELLLYNFYEGHLFHNNQINQTSNCQEYLFNPNKILRDTTRKSRMKDVYIEQLYILYNPHCLVLCLTAAAQGDI